MKITTTLFLFFSFFLAFVTITATPSSVAHNIVRDTDDAAVTDIPYYFSFHYDQGLQIATIGNDICALSVTESPAKDLGLPLKFSNISIRNIVYTNDLLNIEFDGITPSHWHVQDGYVQVKFSNENPEGTFMLKIDIDSGVIPTYNIMYCPPLDSKSGGGGDDEESCKYLKFVTDDDNINRLVVGDNIHSSTNLSVRFKRKETPEQSGTAKCQCPSERRSVA